MMTNTTEIKAKGNIQLEKEFEREVRKDSDKAARERLARWLSISYRNHDTPPGHVIREYPDGTTETVLIELGSKQIASSTM